ncbi:hypothetical protein [Nocardia gipuzkoensis]
MKNASGEALVSESCSRAVNFATVDVPEAHAAFAQRRKVAFTDDWNVRRPEAACRRCVAGLGGEADQIASATSSFGPAKGRVLRAAPARPWVF